VYGIERSREGGDSGESHLSRSFYRPWHCVSTSYRSAFSLLVIGLGGAEDFECQQCEYDGATDHPGEHSEPFRFDRSGKLSRAVSARQPMSRDRVLRKQDQRSRLSPDGLSRGERLGNLHNRSPGGDVPEIRPDREERRKEKAEVRRQKAEVRAKTRATSFWTSMAGFRFWPFRRTGQRHPGILRSFGGALVRG
jgi:hypothetical protein